MSDNKMTLFELKEKAKWSSDPEEKKAAIKELSTYGENAISALQEIMNITAYEDIKNACAEAIKSMHRQQQQEEEAYNNAKVNETSSSTTTATTNSSKSAPDAVVNQDQKKEKFKKEEEGEEEAEKHMREFNQAS